MTLLATLLLTSAISTAQEPKTYSDDKLDLKFQYPAEWKLERRRNDDVFKFQAADGSEVTVQIFKFFFRQEKDKWQEIQRSIATQMGRRVVRQWEEQILGVPLLMTRIEFNADDLDQVTQVGLLYVAREQKMNFRVTSTLGAASDAEKTWRSALMSLRTVSGELPIPEDPSKPLPNPSETANGDPIKTFRPDDDKAKPVRSNNFVAMTKAGRNFNVHMPKGWTLKDDEGKLSLINERLKGKVKLDISIGGPVQAKEKLRVANNADFKLFKLVKLREAPKGALSKAGAYVISSLRIGQNTEDKEMCLWHIIGSAETMVWKVDYESGSREDVEADRKMMKQLEQTLAVVITK